MGHPRNGSPRSSMRSLPRSTVVTNPGDSNSSGGLLGGLLGLVLIQVRKVDLLWLPRLSPIVSADALAIPVLGFGLVFDGVVGTLSPKTGSSGPALVVKARTTESEKSTTCSAITVPSLAAIE